MTVGPDRPQEPLAIPCGLLDIRFELGQFRARPGRLGREAQPVGDLRVDIEAIPDLEGHHDRFAVIAHLHAVIPVRVKSAGEPVPTRAFDIKFQRPPQVTQHRRLPFVGVRQHLPVEIKVAGLCDVIRHRVEEPLAVVGAKLLRLRRLFAAGTVAEGLDHRNGAARCDLPG